MKIALASIALFAAAASAPAQQFSDPLLSFVSAVKSRDGDKATQLLRDNPGGIVDSKDGDGNTGLIIALGREDETWTAFLLTQGADPNLGGHGGDTPLIVAARVGFEDAIEWLISKGAKVNLANKMGETPLIVAVQQRQIPIIRVLLAAGADPDKSDSAAGLSARDYAGRDTRSRQILQMIEARKPKPASATPH